MSGSLQTSDSIQPQVQAELPASLSASTELNRPGTTATAVTAASANATTENIDSATGTGTGTGTGKSPSEGQPATDTGNGKKGPSGILSPPSSVADVTVSVPNNNVTVITNQDDTASVANATNVKGISNPFLPSKESSLSSPVVASNKTSLLPLPSAATTTTTTTTTTTLSTPPRKPSPGKKKRKNNLTSSSQKTAGKKKKRSRGRPMTVKGQKLQRARNQQKRRRRVMMEEDTDQLFSASASLSSSSSSSPSPSQEHHHYDSIDELSSPQTNGRKHRQRHSHSHHHHHRYRHEVEIRSDQYPQRLVNPLLELPTPSTIVVRPSEPGVEGAQGKSTTAPSTMDDPTIHGSELVQLTDLVYYPPDTYPLSYLARLLGFQVPIPPSQPQLPITTATEKKKTSSASGDTPGSAAMQNYEFPVPMDVDQLSFLDKTQDVFFQVPPLGTTSPSSRLRLRRPRHQEQLQQILNSQALPIHGDSDDQDTLDYMDPVYAQFLKYGFDKTLSNPGAPSLMSRLAATYPIASTRTAILNDARKIFASSKTKNDTIDVDNNSNEGQASSSCWTYEPWTASSNQNSEWKIDEKIYTTPPLQYFGILALYKGTPLYLLHYKFQWYPALKKTKESELVMIIEGVIRRSGTATTTAMAMATEATNQTQRNDDFVSKEEEIIPNEKSETFVDSSNTTSASAASLPPLPKAKLTTAVRLLLLTFAFEHAKAADIWYCLWNAPLDYAVINHHCFRMTYLPGVNGKETTNSKIVNNELIIPMVGDLKKCSWKYALLKYRDVTPLLSSTSVSSVHPYLEGPMESEMCQSQRVLVRFPLAEEATSLFDAKFAETQRSKRASVTNTDSMEFTSAPVATRNVVVGVRARIVGKDDVELETLEASGEAEGRPLALKPLAEGQSIPSLDILRRFPLAGDKKCDSKENDEILDKLKKHQMELSEMETALEPRLRSLMKRVVAERDEFERPEARAQRAQEVLILEEHDNLIARRKELDLAREEQLEQDMNAVCSICNDGEVTPDNQILFCEACDVPIHQFCYGIETIPEGDYYCIACQFFQREKMSRESDRTSSTGARIALPPLPICCELCPIKEGAFVQTDTSQSAPNFSRSKWVHMACAKWQGLNFLIPEKADLVEDVTELKKYFRRMDIRCFLCDRQRGAYHQCRHEDCSRYLHLSCARAVGVCEVIHGEDVDGPVETNPWTLLCPEHSNIGVDDIPKDAISQERLREIAKKLPDEPMPEPINKKHKPFNKLNGKERKYALADPIYENAFLEEILTKRFNGTRCQVCWTRDHDGKGLARCVDCSSTICFACRLSDTGEINPDQRRFRCFGCRFVREKEKAKEDFEMPECQMCNQNHGLLLKGVAKPVNKKAYWSRHEDEFKKTLFARNIWTHYTCAYWLSEAGVVIDSDQHHVECSNVVMSNGLGFVRSKQKCYLCGLNNGMKVGCCDKNCRARGQTKYPYTFHVTCARAAGYEVEHSDDIGCYLKCYFHGACEFNFRAQVEDLIEVEKRRAGKTFSRSQAPMNFQDGSRLMYNAIDVLRTLAWSWRWAEHWVEYGSNWEPLLEPGQKEENMTKKQLKIIDSSPDSRAEDARRCRLSALGAALRNRAYDTDSGVDDEALTKALVAVMSTESLVGPLKKYEISFLVEWLKRAYRSKAKSLGLGSDKIAVGMNDFCLHQSDKTPKHELGNRPLPGKGDLESGSVFERKVDEPDDFLLPELSFDGTKCLLPPNGNKHIKKKIIKYQKADEAVEDSVDTKYIDASRKSKLKKPVNTEDTRATKVPLSKQKKASSSKRSEVVSESSPQSKSRIDSVAAIVPSAVKKRGRPVRQFQMTDTVNVQPAIVESPTLTPMVKALFEAKKHNEVPSAIAEFLHIDLLNADNPDSVLRKQGRRGKPPKLRSFIVFVKVDEKDFFPDPCADNESIYEDIPRIEAVESKSLPTKTPRKADADENLRKGINREIETVCEKTSDFSMLKTATPDESHIVYDHLPKTKIEEVSKTKIEQVSKISEDAKSKQRTKKVEAAPAVRSSSRKRTSVDHYNPETTVIKTTDISYPIRKRQKIEKTPTPVRRKLGTTGKKRGRPSKASLLLKETTQAAEAPRSTPSPTDTPTRTLSVNGSPGRPRRKTSNESSDEDGQLLGETLVPVDEELHIVRGRSRANRAKGKDKTTAPSPTKRILRRSARSPTRPIMDTSGDSTKSDSAT